VDKSEEWEGFFDPSRRELRGERKRARRSDRSKYKVTDRDKGGAKKALPLTGLIEGKVTQIRSHEIDVTVEDHVYLCTLKGALKFERDRLKNLVAVGDNVLFEPITAHTGSIHSILPRSSLLSRLDHLRLLKEQCVAANIDLLLITVGLTDPVLKTAVIDRYLVAARKGNLQPLILINKMDLAEQCPEEAALVQEAIRLYDSLGVRALCLSARTGEGVDELRKILAGKTAVFSGQSGTGKTCIINALTGLSLKTSSIRAIGKGAHTTSSTRLIAIPSGGWCIDTPGIRSFGIFALEQQDLVHEFSELFSQPCAFANCWHTGEKGCAVPDAIEKGTISPLRYSSYLSLLAALEEEKDRSQK
jgi:ribosome biogenesis GTPase / thiamine phosphate phosphatase